MKKLFLSVIALSLLSFMACKEASSSDSSNVEEIVETEEEVEAPDYAAFNQKVEILKAFVKAHENEDLAGLSDLVSDTLKFSPPEFNGDKMLGKDEFLSSLKSYHDNFENIKYTEGISLGDIQEGGWWSGSAFPEGSASSTPTAIRMYGNWTATHTESQKEIGVKFYAIGWINSDQKIAMYTSYFDVNGIAAQLAE